MKITIELDTHMLTADQHAGLRALLDQTPPRFLAEPTSAQLREETIAIAVRQDGADARAVGDWTAGEPIRAGDRIIDTEGREQVAVEITPIRRSDVRLKVGDVVADDAGTKATVVRDDDGGIYPIVTSDGYTYTSRGFQVARGRGGVNIVSVNGRPIIDSEEA